MNDENLESKALCKVQQFHECSFCSNRRHAAGKQLVSHIYDFDNHVSCGRHLTFFETIPSLMVIKILHIWYKCIPYLTGINMRYLVGVWAIHLVIIWTFSDSKSRKLSEKRPYSWFSAFWPLLLIKALSSDQWSDFQIIDMGKNPIKFCFFSAQ